MSTFGSWQYTCDRSATVEAYLQAPCGSAARCSCSACRNFVRVREQVFPKAFVELLDSLGIDPSKDGEIYHNGQLLPGCHDYAGWFHFVGTLEHAGGAAVDLGGGFTVWLCRKSAPALPPLNGKPLVQVEFHATAVPWQLNEAEPE